MNKIMVKDSEGFITGERILLKAEIEVNIMNKNDNTTIYS